MGILSSDVKHIVINLDPPPMRPFLPGETVSGTVTLKTEKEGAKVAKVNLDVSGKVHVEWKEQQGTGDHKKMVTRNQTIEFFKLTITLESSQKVLSMGDNLYNFSFTIPDDARSSFIGSHGSVKYFMKVLADCPWGKDAEESKLFHVNGINDLNKQHDTLETFEETKAKTFGLMCCESGPLTIKLNLEKTGFVCGECIGIIAEVNNKSDKRIGAVNVAINQKIHYKADGDNKYETTQVVDEFSIGSVEPGAEELLEHQLKVPVLPPSHKDPYAINISYSLYMAADPDGAGLDLNMPLIGLVIGNVPHKKAFANFANDDATVELSEKIKTEYGDIPKVKPSNNYLVYSYKKL